MENKVNMDRFGRNDSLTKIIEMPAPTAWPIILAFGLTLVFAGLVTSSSVSLPGAVLAMSGGIGWFRDVLPHQKHESVSATETSLPVSTNRPRVAAVEWMTEELHRARLPLEVYPIGAGVKGGVAGAVAMAVLAVMYGIISGRGMWYAINVLAAGFFPGRHPLAQIGAFQWDSLLIASVLHLLVSLSVGLLYGATLPMLPRHPILLGGLIAPILWSGLVHSFVELIDPQLNQQIDWLWFVFSQAGFGIVAGIVVSQQERVPTQQRLPFAVRAGFEVLARIDEDGKDEGEPR
ncbi:MAG: hypothetical protein WB714_06590 [Candidatus Sulfotelmatobacter sp.]